MLMTARVLNATSASVLVDFLEYQRYRWYVTYTYPRIKRIETAYEVVGKLFRSCGLTGFAGLEVSPNGLVHAHCLARGEFDAVDFSCRLHRERHRGQARYAKIEEVGGVAGYVTKYAAKCGNYAFL